MHYYGGGDMIPKPKYKAMVRHARRIVEQYAEHPGPFGVNPSIVFGSMSAASVNGQAQRVSDREVKEAWPYIVKEIGLVQDMWGEWTLPGRESIVDEFRGR